jgi:hypothetical protein
MQIKYCCLQFKDGNAKLLFKRIGRLRLCNLCLSVLPSAAFPPSMAVFCSAGRSMQIKYYCLQFKDGNAEPLF